jgi:hypothetical protein
MKHLALVALTVSFIIVAPSLVFAFGGSEKDQMREDVREALNRARDFSAQKVREATESLERERGAKEVKKKRAEFEAEQEALRQEYVRERNARPSDFLQQARLEREFDQKRLLEGRAMDNARKTYVHERRKVQHIIETKAHIDENQEYGL